MVSDAWHTATQAKHGEVDKAAVKSAVTLTGSAAGIPSRQANKSIDAIATAQGGQDVTPWEYVNGPEKD